ncbi:hypothetical protein V8E51_002468 [Hyaloscypha variabilis]
MIVPTASPYTRPRTMENTITHPSIRTRLWYCLLSSLPNCVALSYEWGSPARDHDIFCEGKIVKVTSNLLAAL